MDERRKPYLRDRRVGDPCDFPDCDVNSALHRVNPKGEAGIFMCRPHVERSWEYQRTLGVSHGG